MISRQTRGTAGEVTKHIFHLPIHSYALQSNFTIFEWQGNLPPTHLRRSTCFDLFALFASDAAANTRADESRTSQPRSLILI